jgi:hypothetical protein
MIRIAIAALLALALLSPAHAKPDERELIQRSWKALEWIERKTGYSIEGIELRFAFVPEDAVNLIVYGDQRPKKARYHALAAYDRGVIFLQDSFSIERDEAILVHVLTYLAQDKNGARFPCKGKRAREAYDLQNKWARIHGGFVASDLWVAIASTCFLNGEGK